MVGNRSIMKMVGNRSIMKIVGNRSIIRYEKLFGGTEFQNRFKKRRKHLLNLGSLEKDCF